MRLLIIGVPELYESRRIRSEGRRLGHQVTVSRFDRLVFEAGGADRGGGQVLLGQRPIDRHFDTVYIRYFYPYVSEALFLAEWADRRGLRVIDRSLATDNFVQSKTYVAWKLAAVGLPVVPGFQAMRLSEARRRLAKSSRPLVAKGVHGSKGKYVFKLDDPKTAADNLTEELVGFFTFQELLKIRQEFRVLVIGGRYFGAISKTAPAGDFRRNISLGGAAEATDLPLATRRLCQRAAKALKYEMAGVDLAVAEDGQSYIIEVNRSPGFAGFEDATGLNVAKRFIEMASGG